MPKVTLTDLWQAYRFAENAQRFYTDAIPAIRLAIMEAKGSETIKIEALPAPPRGYRTCTPPYCHIAMQDLVFQIEDTARYFHDLAGILRMASQDLNVDVNVYPVPGTCKPKELLDLALEPTGPRG